MLVLCLEFMPRTVLALICFVSKKGAMYVNAPPLFLMFCLFGVMGVGSGLFLLGAVLFPRSKARRW